MTQKWVLSYEGDVACLNDPIFSGYEIALESETIEEAISDAQAEWQEVLKEAKAKGLPEDSDDFPHEPRLCLVIDWPKQ